MKNLWQAETLKLSLESLTSMVSVNDIVIKDDLITSLSAMVEEVGEFFLHRLDIHDAPALFEFYTAGLSEKSRRLFAPYPLFHTPPASADELAHRIIQWKDEPDWTALGITKDNRVIALGILKRFRTDQVTSGIAVRDEFSNKGIGHLLLSAIVEQARLLGLTRFHIKVISDNIASIKLHEKCGFRQTRILPPPLYDEILQYLKDNDKKNNSEIVNRYVMEMVIDLKPNNFIGIKDFADAFATTEDDIVHCCGDLLKSLNFAYEECSSEMREQIFLDSIKKCDNSELSISGSHRLNDWRKGWNEILEEFQAANNDLKILVPKDLHPNRQLRFNGNYIMPLTKSFEHDFALVFRHWLFKTYFKDYDNIYEFGCGTGQNLAIMAELFPTKYFFGMDWVPESQQLIKIISEKNQWRMQGHRFDFFNPDYTLDILPNSLVYTSSAMEQLGCDFDKFLTYLLVKKPDMCINVECINECYDENVLFDYVAIKYHKTRNYLDGFLTRLQDLEKEKKIEIITTRRTGFGSMYHEGYMFVIWKIL